jgi:hypothetical protein
MHCVFVSAFKIINKTTCWEMSKRLKKNICGVKITFQGLMTYINKYKIWMRFIKLHSRTLLEIVQCTRHKTKQKQKQKTKNKTKKKPIKKQTDEYNLST